MHLATFTVALITSTYGASQAAQVPFEPIVCTSDEREVSFTPREVTISNLDVSPDGKRVVFDLLGDIYVLPIQGGKAVTVTHGKDWDVRPVWSPDGRKIAFISDRAGSDHVFVVDAGGGGTPRKISSGASFHSNMERVIGAAEWMPNSKALVVDGALLPVDRAVAPKARIDAVADGTYHSNGIALYHFRPMPEAAGSYTLWQLGSDAEHWLDTGEVLSNEVMSAHEAPLISRDGQWLVYKDRSPVAAIPSVGSTPPAGQAQVDTVRVRVRDRRTSIGRVLLAPGRSPGWRDNGDGRGVFPATGRYAITPDSKYLLIAYGGGLYKVNLRTGENLPIPVSVDVKQCLAPMAHPVVRVDEDTTLSVRNMRGSTLRPDGKQLIFSALRRLYIVDPRGGAPTPLALQSVGQFQPAYSPDGKWIAYASWDEAEGGHIWRIPSQGGVPQRITREAGYYETPIWSPDGKRIAFVGSDDIAMKRSGFTPYGVHGGALHVVSLGSGVARKLPVQARLGHPPTFSKDGQEIWYVPYDKDLQLAQTVLRSIGVDGAPPRSLSVESGQSHNELVSKLLPRDGASRVVPSPDGQLMALIAHGNLQLLRCQQALGSKDFSVDACASARITSSGAYDPRWRDNGRELEWSFADTYYRANTQELLDWMISGGQATPIDSIVRSVTTHLVVPRTNSRGSIVMTGARIVTMRGNEVIENGSIRVEDGRIAQVGSAAEVSIPAGAKVVDLHNKTVLPGFIDTHAHFRLPRDLLDRNNGEPLVYLAYGVTTTKDPSNGGDHGFAYSELVKVGEMVGPRLINAEALYNQKMPINSFDDALGYARRTQRLGGTFLKYHTGYDRGQRRWIMEAARQTGLGVAAHWPAQNYVEGRLNATTLVDGTTSAEHAFTGGRDVRSDVVEFIARSGVSINFAAISSDGKYYQRYWDLLSRDPRLRRFYVDDAPKQYDVPGADDHSSNLPALAPIGEDWAELIASIAHAGGNTTIGSHGDYKGVGFHLEMWAYVRGGMTPHEVLRAATLNGARSAGADIDLGSIEPGKVADLIVLGKNPLDDIRNTLSVEKVMQGGILRDAMTLDELWPERKPLPAWKLE